MMKNNNDNDDNDNDDDGEKVMIYKRKKVPPTTNFLSKEFRERHSQASFVRSLEKIIWMTVAG